MRLLYSYYIQIDLAVDNHMHYKVTIGYGGPSKFSKFVFMKINSSLSLRKCTFEYFLTQLEQMYLARPTEDQGIDSMLVVQCIASFTSVEYVEDVRFPLRLASCSRTNKKAMKKSDMNGALKKKN